MNASVTQQLDIRVEGMTCAHCAQSVEKNLRGVPGVTGASADFNSGQVEVVYAGEAPSLDALEPSVARAGYRLVRGQGRADPAELARKETRRNLILLITGAVMVLPVMLIHWTGLHGLGWDWVTLGLAVAIQAVIGRDFYRGAVANLRSRHLGMDVLVSIGMGTGLIYGAGLVITAQLHAAGLMAQPWQTPIDKHIYFEAATLLVVFLRLGKYVEARARGNALGALRGLLELAPPTARVRRNGEVATVDAKQVRRGEICAVAAGERIPVDGEVTSGECDVDESMLTGEPIPVRRGKGDTVRAGTIASSGTLELIATAVSGDTTLARIVRLVEDAQRTKAPIQRLADRVSNVFVPVVVGIGVIAFFGWLIAGEGTGRAITHTIAVLVIACPCALGIAVPAAVMIGSGAALKRGILVKNGAALERIAKTAVFAFDKTGTLTEGRPTVTEVRMLSGALEAEVMQALAVVGAASQHPLAKAASQHARQYGAGAPEGVRGFEFPGRGLVALAEVVSGQPSTYIFGTAELLREQGVSADAANGAAEELRAGDASVSLLAWHGRVIAAVGFHDPLRPQARAVVDALKGRGARVVLISGDHERAARRVGEALGMDEVHAGVSPEGKLRLVDELRAAGLVTMIGDGINDAPALARADVGVAVGGGSDVAKESGDLVIMGGRIEDLPRAVDLGRRSLRAIHQNLFLSLCYNVVAIPVAAGLFVWAGLFLPPSYAALAMVLSDFSVGANSARLAAELRRLR
jgi:P-type Cu+ transporter